MDELSAELKEKLDAYNVFFARVRRKHGVEICDECRKRMLSVLRSGVVPSSQVILDVIMREHHSSVPNSPIRFDRWPGVKRPSRSYLMRLAKEVSSAPDEGTWTEVLDY